LQHSSPDVRRTLLLPFDALIGGRHAWKLDATLPTVSVTAAASAGPAILAAACGSWGRVAAARRKPRSMNTACLLRGGWLQQPINQNESNHDPSFAQHRHHRARRPRKTTLVDKLLAHVRHLPRNQHVVRTRDGFQRPRA